MLAATVVALAGVAFGVFVGELRALGPHDGGRGVVLAGDQLNVMLLPGVFSLDGGKQLGIGLFDKNIAVVHDWQSYELVSLETRAAQANGGTQKALSLCGTLPSGSQEACPCRFPRQRRHLVGSRAYRQSRTPLV